MTDKTTHKDHPKAASGELSADQLDDVSGGMGISAAVQAANKLKPAGTSLGPVSIAAGDTVGGDGMPDPQTG
jgi:hypothetical protein